MRLTIGVASYGGMKIQTAMSLVAAVKALPCEITLAARAGPYTHWNRQALLEDAIAEGSTHLMFVDTDVVFPHDGMLRLIALDKDIAGAAYNVCDPARVLGTPLSTLKFADEEGNLIDVPKHKIPKEPFRCFAVATGFMLIKLKSMEKLNGAPPFYCEDGVGEDIWFCRQANAAGLEVWCDPTIRVQHLGEFAY